VFFFFLHRCQGGDKIDRAFFISSIKPHSSAAGKSKEAVALQVASVNNGQNIP